MGKKQDLLSRLEKLRLNMICEVSAWLAVPLAVVFVIALKIHPVIVLFVFVASAIFCMILSKKSQSITKEVYDIIEEKSETEKLFMPMLASKAIFIYFYTKLKINQYLLAHPQES